MKVLVSVASKHGASSEIGAVIGEVLSETGLEVDVLSPEQVASVAPYEAVVLGSGIYAGRWLEPVKALIDRELIALRTRRVWLFSSGPIGTPAKPDGEPPDGAAMRESTGAVDHRVFPGLLERSRLGFAERTLMAVMKAPEGDYRPWDDIRAWAKSIAEMLQPAGRELGQPPIASVVR